MQVVIDDEFVVLPLAGTRQIYAASETVGDFAPHPSGINQRWGELSTSG
jgi:hypothetical protein